MRVLLFVLPFISYGLTAPQGYEYNRVQPTQEQLVFINTNNPLGFQFPQQTQSDAVPQDVNLQQHYQELLQQEAYLKQQLEEQLLIRQQKQEQKEVQEQVKEQQESGELGIQKPTDDGGYQFANQLVQQAQQLIQYEQQEQKQKEKEYEQQQQQVQQQQNTQARLGEIQTQIQQTRLEPPHEQYAPPVRPVKLQTQQQHYEHTFSKPQYQHGVKYNKEFFYLSAPQDDFDVPQDLQNLQNQIKKNLRVLFIRAPENNGITDAALALAKQSVDSQTAIYVLTKQHNSADLANKLQQIRSGAHKPEVIFVKYRTPQEADEAQRTIQAQYEALDGPNHFNHEGVVPSHNFIGSTTANQFNIDPRIGGIPVIENGEDTAVEKPDAKYLPSSSTTITKH